MPGNGGVDSGRVRSRLVIAAIVTLPFMRIVAVPLAGSWVIPADLFLGSLVLVTLASDGRRELFHSRLAPALGAYVAWWALSALWGRADPNDVVQVAYLVAIAACVAQTGARVRGGAEIMWGRVAAVLGACSVLVVLLWYAGAVEAVAPFLSGPGSLPPGNYPRVALLFFGANQLASYLLVGAVLLWARQRDGAPEGRAGDTALASGGMLTTLSLAVGALLVVGTWLEGGRRGALWLRAAAPVVVLLTVLVATLSLPELAEGRFEPSVRWSTWSAAARSVASYPVLGEPPGDRMLVHFEAPDGAQQRLVDAHNTLLDVARRAGLPAALLLVWVLALAVRAPGMSVRGVGLALLAAWGLHGLFGSFENTRHLWVLLGLAAADQRYQATRV